ncbi:hypothetical protein G6O67_008032 [Ophiocordyceps sinensis]|uniref:Uncharacterized protein n=1 Tax=Ophiocordyceps sinensis TaxID=72228 RepID=A0A8H4LSM6_9HYPO|nr:hypothetical protein G6O67_008032 [Ophiocordyceps sinensis]
MPEGAESPPPERQTGAQMNDPLASGHGTDSAEGKDKNSQRNQAIRPLVTTVDVTECLEWEYVMTATLVVGC